MFIFEKFLNPVTHAFKKMLCSKGKQLHRQKTLGNTCGSEDDIAHVMQIHRNMKSSIRQLKHHAEHKGMEHF